MMRTPAQVHERLTLEEPTRRSSNRSVGVVFSAVFAILGLAPMLRSHPPRGWAILMAAGLLAAALLFPRVLAPLARAWIALGLALHAVMSPLVMAMVYYMTVTPLALLLRLLGKDLLRLRLDPDAPSYWIPRTPPGPAPDTMPRQF
jgi:hypothetical protein